MTEAVETQEATETEGRRRGRPRPQEVLARDNLARDLLAEGAKTRNELATAMNVKPGIAYLSIYRLRRAGDVEKVRVDETKTTEDGGKTRSRYKWQLVTKTA